MLAYAHQLELMECKGERDEENERSWDYFFNSTACGATDQFDQAAYFTNYGECVEIFGPVSN